MAEKIKKHKEMVFILGVGLVLAVMAVTGMSGMVGLPNFVLATATSDEDVVVTATVAEWMSFSVTPTSTNLGDLVDSGGAARLASSTNITLNLGTNAGGWQIQIKGATDDGLCHSGGCGTSAVPSVTVTSTIAAGEDKYGANASSTFSGVTVGEYYDFWGQDVVGQLKSANQTLLEKSDLNAAENVGLLKIYASTIITKLAGTYTSTTTLTATSPI